VTGDATKVVDEHEAEDKHEAEDEPAVRAWCEKQLGSAPAEILFTTGNLAEVRGMRLKDGRGVVLKIRPAEPRLEGCAAVHRHLWAAGFPCPQPLTGPLAWIRPGQAASAEALVEGGAPYPSGDGDDSTRARAFGGLLARFIALAPSPDRVPGLAPPPAWIHWDHPAAEVWPAPDDRDVDLNRIPETAWLDELGSAVRARLAAATRGADVIGHCDWESHNLEFREGEPWAVHDWDSVAAAPETVIVGVAAAMWPAGADSLGATLAQSEAFLEAYQRARGRAFPPEQIAQTWAAGAWIRAFNAKKFLLDGLDSLSRAEARERARRAWL
jgi:hypothetical protein